METVIGILLIVMGVFLVISVLMQSSKNHIISGSIAGGAETFFGKEKGKSLDALFNKLTTIITIIFVILVLVLYVMQPSQEEIYADYMKQLQEQGIVDENGNLIEAPETSDEADDAVVEETPADETPAAEDVAAEEDTAAEETETAEETPAEEAAE